MADNIFTELYNKILSLFGQTAPSKEESKDTAVNRLRLVLMQDRTNLTPEIMHKMRSELINVLSKYVELDKEALELNFEQEGEQMALMLSIPVIRAKDEEEIEKALKEDEKAKEEKESESDQNDDANDEEDGEENTDEEETSENEKEVADDNDSDSETENAENTESEEITEESNNNETEEEIKEEKPKKTSKNEKKE